MTSPVVPETMERDLDEPLTVTVQALTMELLTADNSLGAAAITRAYNDGTDSTDSSTCV